MFGLVIFRTCVQLLVGVGLADVQDVRIIAKFVGHEPFNTENNKKTTRKERG